MHGKAVCQRLVGEEPELDKLRAAHRLVENHEAVVKFAARACGQQGNPPVNAPLSDPYAKPGMQYLDAVDAGQILCLLCCTVMLPCLTYMQSLAYNTLMLLMIMVILSQ